MFVEIILNIELILNKRTQRKLFKHIFLELRTFVLKNRVSTFWYQCS